MLKQKYITELPARQTLIRYDASARSWLAVNGTTTATGSGPHGRQAALLVALQHDWPELRRKVDALAAHHNQAPGTVRRIMRAAELLRDGHVYAGEVRSETDPGRFYVVRHNGTPNTYECACEDYQSGRAPLFYLGGRACKHVFAKHLAWLLALDLDAPPIPFDGQATNVVGFDEIYDGGTTPGDIYEEVPF